MKITIHRRLNQTSENLVEIATTKTRILLDTGVDSEETTPMIAPEMPGDKNFDAILISHYNTDHVALVGERFSQVPVYIGEMAARIITASDEYKGITPIPFTHYFQNGVTISIGDINVTPFLVDQPAYDAYMLLIESDGKRILYTGDFRSNGRKSFEEMLVNLPDKVDVLICETDGITREDINPITERDLEEKAVEVISKKNGPVFVLQSITDLDRITTMNHASQRCKRQFLEDLHMAQITDAVGNTVANPDDFIGVKAFLTTGYKPENFRYQMYRTHSRIDKSEIVTQKFVMCIRTSMKKYVKSLSQMMNFHNGVLINSLQGTDAKSPEVAPFLKFAQDKGLEVVSLRTSGHADAMALKALSDAVNPIRIVPLNIENIEWYHSEFPKTPIVKEESLHC